MKLGYFVEVSLVGSQEIGEKPLLVCTGFTVTLMATRTSSLLFVPGSDQLLDVLSSRRIAHFFLNCLVLEDDLGVITKWQLAVQLVRFDVDDGLS